MTSQPLPVAVIVATLLLTTAAYLFGLDRAPVYFGGDEAHFAVHGYALSRTGRDLNGTRFPLFIDLVDPLGDRELQEQFRAWYQPVLFYLEAVTLKVLPFSEAGVRLPTAIIGGLLSPWLLYLVAVRALNDRLLGLTAALVLALSPPHFILSRQALDYVCPIPFVLGWLWCLVTFTERGGLGTAFGGGVLLGCGFYSYIASWVFMPICLVLSGLAYYQSRPAPGRAVAATALGFLLPLGLMVPWGLAHPEMFRETFGRYLVRDAPRLNVDLVGGASSFFSVASIRGMIATYASYFDPVFLFVRGGASMTTSTARSGALLLPVAVFLLAGAYDAVRRRPRNLIAVVALGGLLLAPIPAALVNERRMIQRELVMLPFAALLAAFGVAFLLRQRQSWVRLGTLALLIGMPLQFAYVYADYFTHYKLRSAFYYDSTVFGEVADTLVAADPPAIYLSRELDDSGPKWRFYATKHGREDLLGRTQYVHEGGPEVAAATRGSLLVVYPDASTLARLTTRDRWSVVRSIEDIDHRPASVVLRKQ